VVINAFRGGLIQTVAPVALLAGPRTSVAQRSGMIGHLECSEPGGRRPAKAGRSRLRFRL